MIDVLVPIGMIAACLVCVIAILFISIAKSNATVRDVLVPIGMIIACLVCVIAILFNCIFPSPLICKIETIQMDRWIHSTYDNVISIRNDSLLDSNPPETGRGGGSQIYIVGNATAILGTDDSYEEVIESYSTWLLDHGWKRDNISFPVEFDDPDIFSNATDLFRSDKGKIIFTPWEADNPTDDNTTVYLFQIQSVASSENCGF